MPKNNNQNQTNNSETTPVTPEEIIAEVQATPVETGAEIVQFAGRKGGTNGFAAFNAKRTEAVQNKVQTIQEARKLLAEAATAVNAGDAEAEKVTIEAKRAVQVPELEHHVTDAYRLKH